MFRYFIDLAYNGRHFHGWQLQPNSITVQEALEKALALLLGTDIATTGAGRTDSGVHASHFTLHFDVENAINDGIAFCRALNQLLPDGIFIFRTYPVVAGSHARFTAISRTYKYYIIRRKDPFLRHISLYYYGFIDVGGMNEAASVLVSISDFTSFARLHSGARTNICRVEHAGWQEEGDLLVFSITSDRFLRNMVRSVVGTLMDVGIGKISLEGFREIIEARDRQRASVSAPAHALFLTGIQYPDWIYPSSYRKE